MLNFQSVLVAKLYTIYVGSMKQYRIQNHLSILLSLGEYKEAVFGPTRKVCICIEHFLPIKDNSNHFTSGLCKANFEIKSLPGGFMDLLIQGLETIMLCLTTNELDCVLVKLRLESLYLWAKVLQRKMLLKTIPKSCRDIFENKYYGIRLAIPELILIFLLCLLQVETEAVAFLNSIAHITTSSQLVLEVISEGSAIIGSCMLYL